jgi:hypothetical protein
MKKVKFKSWDCIVSFGSYSNGRTAIRLMDALDGAPVATATVNVPDAKLEKDEVVIKNWSENAGILRALIEHNVVLDTGKKVRCGVVSGYVCKVIRD